MCGIIGLLSRDRHIRPEDTFRLSCALENFAYRGPDGTHAWNTPQVLLGHRRLSIIDLSAAGQQPFVDERRGLVISFNGEIYNYQDLRQTLTSMGYEFRSQTDTEVILHAYDRYGVEFLPHLKGMFAFCLYDQKKNTALLARDPAGEKPLFYYFDSKQLVFASETKTFHAFEGIDLSVDLESVKAFFALQYVPGPHSVYRHVRQVRPGTALEVDLDSWKTREIQYWSIGSRSGAPSSAEEIDSLLSQSVRYRLIADVEVGLMLSGGIDSALLASYAVKNGARPRVFTARFDDERLDESSHARQVVDALQLEHIMISGGQVTPDVFDRVIFHADGLLGDPACVPTFLLAQEISRHVKVVLSGEGADELFWGYDTYRYEQAWRRFSWLREAFSRSPRLQRMVTKWETSSGVPAAWTRLAKLLSASYDTGAARWTSVFADHTLSGLFGADPNPGESVYLRGMQQSIHELQAQMGTLEGAMAGDILFWLPDDLLMKVDRMTMAHSVEARAPFLAPEVILKALSLPAHEKVQGNKGKYVLRKLIEQHYPGEVGQDLAWRKKHGFETPVDAWLRDNLRETVEDRLSATKLAASGLFDIDFVTKLKDEFYTSNVDTPLRRKLWLLLCFQSWWEWDQQGFGFRVPAHA